MKKYMLHNKLQANNGNGHNLAAVLIEASKFVATVNGCSLYANSIDKENGDDIWVTEIWETKEDHDNSLQNDSVRELITLAMPYLDGRPSKGRVMDLIGGFGV